MPFAEAVGPSTSRPRAGVSPQEWVARVGPVQPAPLLLVRWDRKAWQGGGFQDVPDGAVIRPASGQVGAPWPAGPTGHDSLAAPRQPVGHGWRLRRWQTARRRPRLPRAVRSLSAGAAALGLTLAVLLSLLLASCSRAPGPDAILRQYLDAWQRQDYAAMYALLDAASRQAISQDDFTDRYRRIEEGIERTGLSAEVHVPDDFRPEGDQVTLSFSLTPVRIFAFPFGR